MGAGTDRENSIRAAARLLLLLLLIMSIGGGALTALGYTPRPRAFGWVLGLGGYIAAILTVDQWARALPGIFGLATVNGLIMLVTGHALTQPSVQVSRVLTTFFVSTVAGGAVATLSMVNRPLTVVRRTASLGILSCFVGMLFSTMAGIPHWETPVSFGFAGCVAALLIETLRSRTSGVDPKIQSSN